MRSNPAALRLARQRAGHTGRTLSAASGVSQQRISELEGDPIPLRPTTAKALADALGCQIEDIVDIEATVQ